MKAAFILCLAQLVSGFSPAALAGLCDDYVYLRRVGSERQSPPRFELLKDRPLFMPEDVVRVCARDVEGLERHRAEARSVGTTYVVRTSPSVLPDRYEVRTLPPGVSYMQSIGAGGGIASVPLARAFAASRGAALPVARAGTPPQSTSTPGTAHRQNTVSTSSRRPFGWPPYDNPLERRAYR